MNAISAALMRILFVFAACIPSRLWSTVEMCRGRAAAVRQDSHHAFGLCRTESFRRYVSRRRWQNPEWKLTELAGDGPTDGNDAEARPRRSFLYASKTTYRLWMQQRSFAPTLNLSNLSEIATEQHKSSEPLLNHLYPSRQEWRGHPGPPVVRRLH